MILVDTDALIECIRSGRRIGDAISVVTLLEYLRGVPAEKRALVKELLEEAFDVVWLDNEVILKYCELYDSLRGRGELIGDADLLIGATAIAKGFRLYTRNMSHFSRLKDYGLVLYEEEEE